jgi:hypothetical protein
LNIDKGGKGFSDDVVVVGSGTSGEFCAFERGERKIDLWPKNEPNKLNELNFHSSIVCLAGSFKASARAGD